MEISSKEAAQRKEFFKNSFKGNFSDNSGVSSVSSFLRSITGNDNNHSSQSKQQESGQQEDIHIQDTRKFKNQ